jgi:N-acetylneuraminic acid mutarotase
MNWERVRPTDHPSSRSRSGVSRLGNDKVLLVGGHVRVGDFVRENDIWCFDTNTENFEKIEPKIGKEPPKISRLCLESFDDTVYSFGGILQNKKKINTVFSFDLKSREWQEIQAGGTPPSGRCDPVTCAYECGDKKGILVFGGSQEGLIFPSDVHFFNIGTNTWEPVHIDNSPPVDRIGACATIIGDKFYLYGGAFWNKETSTYSKNYHEVWCLHLGKGTWRWEQLPSYGESPSGAPVNLTAVPIGNHILIEGSMSCNGSYLYDTVTYTWSKLSPKTTTNDANYGSATLVGDTVYYLCGYRAHNHARDVIKLSLSTVLDFVRTGKVPAFMKESNVGEPMEEEELPFESKLVTVSGSSGSDGEMGILAA